MDSHRRSFDWIRTTPSTYYRGICADAGTWASSCLFVAWATKHSGNKLKQRKNGKFVVTKRRLGRRCSKMHLLESCAAYTARL
mmetsp:Transcript_16643/g.31561  ORF Transcript_16643/g.31561 Transcript_16643/m.31561 type:complete len:83 (+) Transcript_16643:99-347(+)